MPPDPVAAARRAISRLSTEALTLDEARLYSQFTRMVWGGASMRWDTEAELPHLLEAVRLIHCAQTIRDSGGVKWEGALLRAAELLEWLSGANRALPRPRLRLISSAAYQLSGYPARARSLVRDGTSTDDLEVLPSFLRADFSEVQRALLTYWGTAYRGIEGLNARIGELTEPEGGVALQTQLGRECAAAIGVLAAEIRWGRVGRLDAALEKLRALSDFQLLGEEADAWLLSHLVADVGRRYAETNVRKAIAPLLPLLAPAGRVALERYARASISAGRCLAWPSQRRGIERLQAGGSFALCTPTGSGKTLVAELAILVGLFGASELPDEAAPLILYLTPSRALAAEVESRLARVVRFIRAETVQVTGLYGGTEWGPTDAWVTTDRPTVVICTHEKAEALIRYLGHFVLDRLALLIVDEVHAVQQGPDLRSLSRGESRALRLEALLARVFREETTRPIRVIGLSAVAKGFETELSRWIAGSENSAETSGYRSTRQLIGRLECYDDCSFEIRYDLLNGQSLEFVEGAARDVPFVRNPFGPRPRAPSFDSKGPEKSLRPSALWAALQLSKLDGTTVGKSVLISVNQNVSSFASDILQLLTDEWGVSTVGEWFKPPTEGIRWDLWEQCLASCEDYFGSDAVEYRLLKKGVLLHHGGLPPAVSRSFVRAIEARLVPIVIATSTLSEGVNLPVDVVLVPSLLRFGKSIATQEFLNLSGRAGRPGFAVEGQTLVLLHARASQNPGQGRTLYTSLIRSIRSDYKQGDDRTSARSPLGALLEIIWSGWKQASKSEDPNLFLEWLEQTAPGAAHGVHDLPSGGELTDQVDSLDGVLLPMVVEGERLSEGEISPTALETALKEYWSKTYAHAALSAEGLLERMFVRRGKSLRFRHFADPVIRRRIYRSGLTPRWAQALASVHPQLVEHLRSGIRYAGMSPVEKVAFIDTTLDFFEIVRPLRWQGDNPERLETLHWWLDPASAPKAPQPAEVATWFEAVNHNFTYRAAWGLGSALAISLDAVAANEERLPRLEDWPRSGLPWIAFWMKELLSFGTLDPVAAYALARKFASTRGEASRMATDYYRQADRSDLNGLLDPRRVRDWFDARPGSQGEFHVDPPRLVAIEEIHEARVAKDPNPYVWPIQVDSGVLWVDIAGYPIARSAKASIPDIPDALAFDFLLNPGRRRVELEPYL